jgi:type II secretory pathway component PulC
MLRGLVIRRGFIFLDLVLIAAIAIMAAFVVRDRLSPPFTFQTGPESDTEDVAAIVIPKVGTISRYNKIKDNGLFGEAGRYNPDKPPPEPPPIPLDVDIYEGKLQLKGTTFTADQNPLFASASIINLDKSREGSTIFYLGDTVVEKVTLLEIEPRAVLLLNKNKVPQGKKEKLSMDDDVIVPAQVAPTKPVRSQRTERRAVKKEDLIKELTTNYAELSKVEVKMSKDSKGKVNGITADDIGNYALAKQLGLENKDVLQTVNNEKIDSKEKVYEIMQKYANAGSIRIGILRDGKSKVITYNVQ